MAATNTIKKKTTSSMLVSVAVGVLAGLVGGVVISILVWLAKSALGRHISYFASNSYLYFLALPIEIGLGCAIFPKNRAFALSFTITAICISAVVAVICIVLDGFPELD